MVNQGLDGLPGKIGNRSGMDIDVQYVNACNILLIKTDLVKYVIFHIGHW